MYVQLLGQYVILFSVDPAVMCTGDGGSGPALGGDIPTGTVLSIMEHGSNLHPTE